MSTFFCGSRAAPRPIGFAACARQQHGEPPARQMDEFRFIHSLGPVSYTHLDVYKRQDMAVTKTHPIKSTLKAAIDYICNPDKTDGRLLVSSFGCTAETADIEFAWTLSYNISCINSLYKQLIGGIKIRLKISIFYGEKVVHLADF